MCVVISDQSKMFGHSSWNICPLPSRCNQISARRQRNRRRLRRCVCTSVRKTVTCLACEATKTVTCTGDNSSKHVMRGVCDATQPPQPQFAPPPPMPQWAPPPQPWGPPPPYQMGPPPPYGAPGGGAPAPAGGGAAPVAAGSAPAAGGGTEVSAEALPATPAFSLASWYSWARKR